MGCIPQPIVPFPSVLARSTPSRSHYTTRHVVPGTEVPVFLPSGNVLACFVTSGCHGACVSANRYCCCHARNYTARHVVPGTRYSFFLHAGEFLACFVTTGNRLGFQGIDTAVHVLPGMLYQVLCFFSQYPVTTGHKRKFQGGNDADCPREVAPYFSQVIENHQSLKLHISHITTTTAEERYFVRIPHTKSETTKRKKDDKSLRVLQYK